MYFDVLRSISNPNIACNLFIRRGYRRETKGQRIPVKATEHSAPFQIYLNVIKARRWRSKSKAPSANHPLRIGHKFAKPVMGGSRDLEDRQQSSRDRTRSVEVGQIVALPGDRP